MVISIGFKAFSSMSRTFFFKSETRYSIFEALPETQYIWNLFNTRWLQYYYRNFRSYIADLNHKVFFHGCEVALTSHICFPISLVFHQHLNSHIAYPGIPPEPSNHTRGQFLHLPSYPLLRLLWSKSDNKVTRKRILDQYHTGTSFSSTALR